MSDREQTAGCQLPPERPAVCPTCGANAGQRCAIDRPNEAVLALVRDNDRLRRMIAGWANGHVPSMRALQDEADAIRAGEQESDRP